MPRILQCLLLCLLTAGPLQAGDAVWTDNGDGRAHVWYGREPQHGSVLKAECEVAGGSVLPLDRMVIDGMQVTVWLTPHLGAGMHRLRMRWWVDGSAQSWSAWSTVVLTDQALPERKAIDPYGDGSVVLAFDQAYPAGQFTDGEWFIVAPQGVLITAATPASTGTGRELRHGLMRNPTLGEIAVDGRHSENFNASRNLTPPLKATPGDVLYKVQSWIPSCPKDPSRLIRRAITLTVLSTRPPAGSFRPAVYGNAERALRNAAEVDLSLLPDLVLPSLPDQAARDLLYLGRPTGGDMVDKGGLMRPALAMGSSTSGSRSTYPTDNTSGYHRTTSRDLAAGMLLSMTAALPADERQRFALAVVQRVLDIRAMHQSARQADMAPAYWWEGPFLYAGTVLQDVRLRAFARHGEAALAEYQNWSYGGGRKIYAWNEVADPAIPFRRKLTDPLQTWQALRAPRTVLHPSGDKRLAALGIADQGNGTWIIPAGRFWHGGALDWTISAGTLGETGLLNPAEGLHPSWAAQKQGAQPFLAEHPFPEGWSDKRNLPMKAESYRYQHSPQVATFTLIAHLLGMEDYFSNPHYGAYGRQYMTLTRSWCRAVGLPPSGVMYIERGGYGFQGTQIPWLDADLWWSLHDQAVPSITSTVPPPPALQTFEITDLGNGSDLQLTLKDVPDDGWSPLSRIEYATRDAWYDLGSVNVGATRLLSGFAPDTVVPVRLRAVNRHGPGPPSPVRSIRLRRPSLVLVDHQATTATGGKASIELPAASPDDLRLLVIARPKGQTCAAPPGWTEARSLTGQAPSLWFFYRPVTKAEPAQRVTVTGSDNRADWRVQSLLARGSGAVAVATVTATGNGNWRTPQHTAQTLAAPGGSLVLTIFAHAGRGWEAQALAELALAKLDPRPPAAEGVWHQPPGSGATSPSLLMLAKQHGPLAGASKPRTARSQGAPAPASLMTIVLTTSSTGVQP